MSSRSRSKLGLRHFKISSIVKEVSGESGVCGEFSVSRTASRVAPVEGGEGSETGRWGVGGVGGVVGEGREEDSAGLVPPMNSVHTDESVYVRDACSVATEIAGDMLTAAAVGAQPIFWGARPRRR